MDFPTPPPVAHALHRFVDAGDLGYPDWRDGPPLARPFAQRMAERYGWDADPTKVRLVCDVIQGVEIVLDTITRPGDGVVVHTPCYPPFLAALQRLGRPLVPIPARDGPEGWAFDLDRLASALDAEPATRRVRALLLCNPQNPTGRVFTSRELAGLADLAERHDLVVISDEIHADLTWEPHTHVPFASLHPAIAARTVTLTSATKAFNLAGIRCAVLHAGPPEVRAAIDGAGHHLGVVSVLGVEATRAAWQDGDPWLAAVRAVLDRNRRLLADLLAERLPGVRWHVPEATYLAWLDCRALELPDAPARWFRRFGVELSPGEDFGPGGAGFARLNVATSRVVLTEVVDRLAAGVAAARA
jgi:cystathionine beta-lyase